jgi:protein pelota
LALPSPVRTLLESLLGQRQLASSSIVQPDDPGAEELAWIKMTYVYKYDRIGKLNADKPVKIRRATAGRMYLQTTPMMERQRTSKQKVDCDCVLCQLKNHPTMGPTTIRAMIGHDWSRHSGDIGGVAPSAAPKRFRNVYKVINARSARQQPKPKSKMQLVNSKVPRLNVVALENVSAPVTLLPVEPEDMWHANNLISPEDVIKAHAVRKVTTESKTGSTQSERVHIDLAISVKSTFFDLAASQLHVSGTVIVENKIVSLGQYHTLDLELNRAFTIWKRYGWDSVAQETLTAALKQDKDGAVAAVVMQEGMANICLITENRTILKQRVETTIPKKRAATSEQSSGMRRFFDKVLTTLTRSIEFDKPRPLLLASPGFVAADFKKYISEEATRTANKTLMAMAKEATLVHSSSGHLHSLNEILKSPEVLATMKDMKFSKETRIMDELFERVRRDDGRAWYGDSTIAKAVAEGAVGRGGGVLLINNSLFRSMNIQTRKKYVAMVDKVREDGGDVRILSSDHESGERLDALGGIAALLTYPMPDLDEEDDEAGEGDEVAAPDEGMII